MAIADGGADLALIPVGGQCANGIGGLHGQCAAGLKCCVIPCSHGPFDGGCLALPSTCEAQPPPEGYGSCF
jgi:hypothetical protein